jgi:hypothetical protein
MPYVGLEPKTPAFERDKTVHALDHLNSTWGNAYPVVVQRHLRGYAKTSYINQNETQEPLEP